MTAIKPYLAVFFSWALTMAVYLTAGARLIRRENLVVYRFAPKDREYVFLNLLWWAVPLTWLIAPALPFGPGWSVGLGLFVGGSTLVIWARRANPFFYPTIRRPPRLITAGPYRRLRHPGYIGFTAMSLGSILMLGHPLGFFPFGCYVGLLISRAHRENNLLRAHKLV
jgi:protein-S-isoprenylcysteine O-methyltransferase Ste14